MGKPCLNEGENVVPRTKEAEVPGIDSRSLTRSASGLANNVRLRKTWFQSVGHLVNVDPHIFCSIAWLLSANTIVLGQSMVQDDGVNAAFALDAASINFRETAKRGLLLLNYDSRIKKERDRFPLHKFSMWRFKEATGSMNFCGVLELSIHLEGATSNAPRPFLYCSDPADFEYSFEAGRLCVTGTHDEIIDGCFALKPRSGLLDWINEYDQIITTSFSGFFTETPGASDQIQGLFVEHSEQELDVLAGNRAKVMAVLVASNLAAPGAADIDVSVRGALATYQRSRGIFASGFLDQVTFSELDRQRRPFR